MNITVNMPELAKKKHIFICSPWPDVTIGSLRIKAKQIILSEKQKYILYMQVQQLHLGQNTLCAELSAITLDFDIDRTHIYKHTD